MYAYIALILWASMSVGRGRQQIIYCGLECRDGQLRIPHLTSLYAYSLLSAAFMTFSLSVYSTCHWYCCCQSIVTK